MHRREMLNWLVLFAVGSFAWNNIAASEDSRRTASADLVVSEGAQFERSGKWIEAIQEYEKGLKTWPDNADIKYGLRRAKVHFGIQRRCEDSSYFQTMGSLSKYEALSLFGEVLEQVRTRYVETVSSTSFVAHGTECLYYALGNQAFVDRYVPKAAPSTIWNFREMLRSKYWNKPVPDYGQVNDAVSEICDQAQRTLGLPISIAVMEYVFGGCNALDEYSSYLTPSRLSDLYENIDGQFVGLGVEIKAMDGEGILLVNVLPESPASEVGLGPGDRIVSVNGVSCRNMSTDEAADLLKGPPDSRVQLEVLSADQLRQTSLLRKRVTVKSIPTAKIVDAERGIGYIRMTGFQRSTVHELDRALYDLKQQGMRALIWDLRGNPGGLLDAAADVSDRFIDQGLLVSTRGRSQSSKYVAHTNNTWKMPLVLLVDENSASASEIVAGAIRDHHRGVLVGRKTYGKWSVQDIITLRYRSGLRLTTAKFYSPNGDNYAAVGVEPDVKVDAPIDEMARANSRRDLDSDPDVQKALEVLRYRSSNR